MLHLHLGPNHRFLYDVLDLIFSESAFQIFGTSVIFISNICPKTI